MQRISHVRQAPVVVVGSGIAGLSAALGLEACVVLTRGRRGSGSSGLAQGGIAAAIGDDDTASAHAADTIAVSGGIADPLIAETVAAAAAGRVEWLLALGARFDRAGGRLALGREAGHSTRRIVHAQGDATGAEVMRALTSALASRPDIEVLEQHDALDLVRSDGRVAGVLARDPAGELVVILARAVILATGGIGGLYARTTNPPEVTGDGLALAARAGVRLADLEFVQFHPTALDVERDPVPLLSEALRGEGALLIDDRGERFMRSVHPNAELAPRDVVARAIWLRRVEGSGVYLDATGTIGEAFPERFPTIFRHALEAGIDPRVEPLPVTPAEHYHMGGVATDEEGRTSLPGLWAIGETACTGLHGANRLASNSLLEGMVMAAAACRSIRRHDVPAPGHLGLEVPADLDTAGGEAAATDTMRDLRALMWRHVGLMRDRSGLVQAIAALGCLERDAAEHRARRAALVGRLIAAAALQRTESRGAHWRSDFPAAQPAFAKRRFLTPPRPPSVALDPRARRAA